MTIKVMSDKLSYSVNTEQRNGVKRNFLYFRNLLLCHRRMKFGRRKLDVFTVTLCGLTQRGLVWRNGAILLTKRIQILVSRCLFACLMHTYLQSGSLINSCRVKRSCNINDVWFCSLISREKKISH